MKQEELIGQLPEKPFFDFDMPLPASPNLDYEMYNWDNYLELYYLFRWDWSKFVAKDFKRKSKLWQYTHYQLYNARFSTKRAACDWYFKTKSGEYAGIIHLYDLSLDNVADRHKRCTIGFATARKFRGKGMTAEAVYQLLRHCFEHFGMEMVLSYTKRDNKKANRFLEKLGFVNNDAAYLSEVYRYYEMPKNRFYNLI
jgi:RimJ/RimL family protein N-acetyltransferase